VEAGTALTADQVEPFAIFDNDPFAGSLGLSPQQLWFRQFGQFRCSGPRQYFCHSPPAQWTRPQPLRVTVRCGMVMAVARGAFDNLRPGKHARSSRKIFWISEFLRARVIMPVVGSTAISENNSLPGWE